MKNKFSYLFILLVIVQIFNTDIIKAQEKSDTIKKVIVQLNPGISVPVIKAWDKLHIGATVSASVHFNLSNSFKIGPDLSYQFNSGKDTVKNFYVAKLSLDLMWFPAALIKSIFKKYKERKDMDNFYISLGFGPGLTSISKGRVVIGATQYVGYLIPLKNRNAINIMVNTPSYLLKKQTVIDENNIYSFVNIFVGYAFR
jgi:hypothetical protein